MRNDIFIWKISVSVSEGCYNKSTMFPVKNYWECRHTFIRLDFAVGHKHSVRLSALESLRFFIYKTGFHDRHYIGLWEVRGLCIKIYNVLSTVPDAEEYHSINISSFYSCQIRQVMTITICTINTQSMASLLMIIVIRVSVNSDVKAH